MPAKNETSHKEKAALGKLGVAAAMACPRLLSSILRVPRVAYIRKYAYETASRVSCPPSEIYVDRSVPSTEASTPNVIKAARSSPPKRSLDPLESRARAPTCVE